MGATPAPGGGPGDELSPDVFALLAGDHGDGPASVIETHASVVFLRENEALKVKKPVRLPYLDYSTLPLRVAACEKEWRINVVAAPEIYCGVSVITRGPDGRLALDEPGETVEAAVRMRRFPQAALLDSMAAAGELDLALMEELAHAVAGAHEEAPAVAGVDSEYELADVLEGTIARVAASPDTWPPARLSELDRRSREAFARGAEVLKTRAEHGYVRRCHGDLHLRNIVMWDGAPVLFDALEFSDTLATTDIFYDLAFVLMDLLHREL
ncbi:MAG: phosphotransferase, partial [Caulobacterales bacterium]|nr:phosphotransferase [Caulobacterales bacterium]